MQREDLQRRFPLAPEVSFCQTETTLLENPTPLCDNHSRMPFVPRAFVALVLIFCFLAGCASEDPAVSKLKALAAKGDSEAQNALAEMYFSGKGVSKNPSEALHWLRESAGQGYSPAQYGLGSLYYDGAKGVPRNFPEAAKWLQLAAQQGSAVAQTKLGALYMLGEGVPKDRVLSGMWLNLAHATESDELRKTVTLMQRLLAQEATPEDIRRSQQLAHDWKPVFPKTPVVPH